jgi:hypothetical protein
MAGELGESERKLYKDRDILEALLPNDIRGLSSQSLAKFCSCARRGVPVSIVHIAPTRTLDCSASPFQSRSFFFNVTDSGMSANTYNNLSSAD